MRIDNTTILEIPIECILLRRAGTIGNLQTAGLPCRVVVEVEVGSFLESVKPGSRGRLGEVVVDLSCAHDQ